MPEIGKKLLYYCLLILLSFTLKINCLNRVENTDLKLYSPFKVISIYVIISPLKQRCFT